MKGELFALIYFVFIGAWLFNVFKNRLSNSSQLMSWKAFLLISQRKPVVKCFVISIIENIGFLFTETELLHLTYENLDYSGGLEI